MADKSLEGKYIVPMTVPLDRKIECDVHFLMLPRVLKEKLIQLEEISRRESKGMNSFIKEKHNLPLNSLKEIFINYLPGVTDMKAVSASTSDERWLVSLTAIDTDLVAKLIGVWIQSFYIDEDILATKRETKVRTRKLAGEIAASLSATSFQGCSLKEHVVLFEDGKVIDKDAYGLLPLMLVNTLIGKKIVVSSHESHWMYSGKNELSTDPIDYKAGEKGDRFSYVVKFSVQTLPPYNKPYLNINVSSRRWVSRRKTDETIYIPDKKSLYFRNSNDKLVKFQVEYNPAEKEVSWTLKDIKVFQTLFGKIEMPKFNEIIASPARYMTGESYSDFYITFEYGMTEATRQLCSTDAGISHRDRKEIFSKIMSYFDGYSSFPEVRAKQVLQNSVIAPVMFTKDFFVEEKRKAGFLEVIDAVAGNDGINVEIWYPSGQEIIRDELIHTLKNQLSSEQAKVTAFHLQDYADPLECQNEKAKDNMKGVSLRINETYDHIKINAGMAAGRTIAIVIIHDAKYYGKSIYDPKTALRYGFLKTGRLTQFLTVETYHAAKAKLSKSLDQGNCFNQDGSVEKKYACNIVIRNTVLDVYRQLGFVNPLSENKGVLKKTGLTQKTAVGIHVINYKKLMNKINMEPCPIIISCDMVKHEVRVSAAFQALPNRGYGIADTYEIDCLYAEFPIKLYEMLESIGMDKRIKPMPSYLKDWFRDNSREGKSEIMIVADGTSRKVIEGISNKEINQHYNQESRNTVSIAIKNKEETRLNLDDFRNIDWIRIRNNIEVPDYYAMKKDEESDMDADFARSSGIYQMDDVFYSRDASPRSELNTHRADASKIDSDEAFQHRRILEIYPMYVCNRKETQECVSDVHNLRRASIQYEAGMTELPLPLHLGKLLEEYLL